MKVQGGEQKVMKKILTVALSTAMAFSMFASVAFGDSAVSVQEKYNSLEAKGIFNGYPDKQAHLERDMTRAEFAKVLTKLLGLKEVTGTLSYKDKGYDAKNWAVPYIEAVTAAGIMEGQDKVKQIFNYNGKVTVEEMATALVRALKLEVPANADNSASSWAKGYIQVAIDKGLIAKEANFQANATREQLVVAAYQADQLINLSVKSYKVADNGKDIEFTLSSGEVVKVTLEKALEPNKETEVKFKNAAGQEITAKVTWVVESATKVASAAATNLKEVEVSFDGKVDKVTATDKNNYSIDSNAKGIKSITLLPDGKTARLLLNESSKFVQGTTYKVVVKNVKSSKGDVLPQGEVAFTAADNTLPQVTEVKSLGTKVIKVTFSEPIVAPSASNFKVDGKQFVGAVTLNNNLREVILKDYTGNIAVGAHKLTSTLIEDHAGLKALSSENDFTTAVDTEGPKVTEVSATLEKVTVTFDEEIDPDSVKDASFYWLSGSSKITGKATQVAGNVYEVAFDGDKRLPGYETTLYIDVKDYSGNAVQTKEVKVNATVDLTQPHVVEANFGVDRANVLTVRFDKAVDAADKKYFTVKKGDTLIPVSNVVPADASNKIFYVNFFNKLASGTYDLKVSGVQDKTALKNTLVEYNGTFVAADTANPEVKKSDYNDANRRVTLNFGREMDVASVQEHSNYFIGFKKNGSPEVQNIALPTEVTVNAVNGAKSVVLQFPEFINGTKVTFGPGGSVQSVYVSGLKSKTGQSVAMFNEVLKSAVENQLTWDKVEQKDARTFELTFSQVVANVNASDFLIDGSYPTSISVNDNVVTLKTDKDKTGATITLFANNSIASYSGNRTDYKEDQSKSAYNAIAPKIASVSKNRTVAEGKETFTITFNTPVSTLYANQLKNDFIIKDLTKDDYPVVNPGEYEAEIKGLYDVVITLNAPEKLEKAPISVEVRDGAQYLVASGTDIKAAKSDAYTVSPATTSVVTQVKVTNDVYSAAVNGEVASADQYGFKFTANKPGKAGNVKVTVARTSENAVDGKKVEIAQDGSKITLTKDATVADVVTAASKLSTLPYKVEAGTTGDVQEGSEVTVQLKGGVDAESAKYVLSLDTQIQKVNKLVIGGKDLTTASTVGTDGKSITVNVDSKYNTGAKIEASVVVNGAPVQLTGEIK